MQSWVRGHPRRKILCITLLFSEAHSSSRRSQCSGRSISQSKMDCYLNLTKTEVKTSNRTASREPADKKIHKLNTKIDKVVIYTHFKGPDWKTKRSKKYCIKHPYCTPLHIFEIIPFESILHQRVERWWHFCPKSGRQKPFPSYRLVSQDQRGPGSTWSLDCQGSSLASTLQATQSLAISDIS